MLDIFDKEANSVAKEADRLHTLNRELPYGDVGPVPILSRVLPHAPVPEAMPDVPVPEPEAHRANDRPICALFCFEEPDSLVGQFVANLAAAFARRQYAVRLFTRHRAAVPAAGVVANAVGTTDGELTAQAEEFTSRACNAFLQTVSFDAAPVSLLGFEWSAAPTLSLLRGLTNLNTVLSLHSVEAQRSELDTDLARQIDAIEQAGIREAIAVLMHDAATDAIVRSRASDGTARLAVVQPMFPIKDFESSLDAGAIKSRYQVGPVDPTILYIGDLDSRYGADLLLKAMPAILKNHKQARLVVVGDGDLLWPLRVYSRYLLLDHAVRVIGHLEGVPLNELIQAADIVVVPSREATPWWPIQAAWAARRPVVATHHAAPGLLEHERDSVLVYPSENSCVWGVERILYDPELGATLASNGRTKLEHRFGWNAVALQVEELLAVTQAS